MSESISKEDMDTISAAKSKIELSAANARVADLEYRNIVQQIFLKYGLKLEDQVDISGNIIRKELPKEKQSNEEVTK
jgi:hypothetical protein